MELSGTKWNEVEPSGTKWNQVELSGTKWDVGVTRQKSGWKAGEMTSRAVMSTLISAESDPRPT